MRHKTYGVFSLVFVLSVLLAVPAPAQTRQMIPFSGTTTLADGTYNLTFTLYDQDFPGGANLYSESQTNIPISNGIFDVVLGPVPTTALTALSGSVYIATEQTGMSGEIGPRVPVYSSGFAHTFNAGASVSGNSSSPILSLINTGTGSAGFFQNTSTGPAGSFQITNSRNGSNTLGAFTNGSGSALFASNNGTGGAGIFRIDNASNNNNALGAFTFGTGNAGVFQIINANNNSNTLDVFTNGTGHAGSFRINNASNNSSALQAVTNGDGPALRAQAIGLGEAGVFELSNKDSSCDALNVTTNGSGKALLALNSGTGPAGVFEITIASNSSTALAVNTSGTGWAGEFVGQGSSSKGVRISVPSDQPGLQVVGGSKNAVVATSKGARALYSEESSEVWFTDYGFGRLQNGVALIQIDPLFAQTVNLNEPYHVFVQLNDPNCEGAAVVNKKDSSFEVMELRNGHSNAEFSYRLVAKRCGFEQKRLERAPWADGDPNVYP